MRSYPDSDGRKPDANAMRVRFDAVSPLTVGVEEEAMLVDPDSLDLLPRAPEVVERAGHPRFKLELPASQVEIVLPPTTTVGGSIAALRAARRDLAAAAQGIGVMIAAGAHPFAAPLGRLNDGERHREIANAFGDVARLQLVCALQVHVAVGGHERSLAVYNALRSHLPELAALAANAPFYAGRDTGLASVRPKLSELLPRQGVPPALRSWDDYADALEWGARATELDAGQWWWELRPRPLLGTLELRVPDAQATVEDAAAIVALAHSLVAWLAARHDAGEPLATADIWRLEENRWSAARWGMDAELADLSTGARTPARECLASLLSELTPVAAGLGCEAELASAAALGERNGAARQREIAAGGGLRAVVVWLADAYLSGMEPLVTAPPGKDG